MDFIYAAPTMCKTFEIQPFSYYIENDGMRR